MLWSASLSSQESFFPFLWPASFDGWYLFPNHVFWSDVVWPLCRMGSLTGLGSTTGWAAWTETGVEVRGKTPKYVIHQLARSWGVREDGKGERCWPGQGRLWFWWHLEEFLESLTGIRGQGPRTYPLSSYTEKGVLFLRCFKRHLTTAKASLWVQRSHVPWFFIYKKEYLLPRGFLCAEWLQLSSACER